MTGVFSDEFLLPSPLSRELYAQVGGLPIIDYHSHLPVDVLAANQPFENLTQLWIRGDHYKWRAMRLNGVPERLCSGEGNDRDKFQAWAATMPRTLRNPLHHWGCLELHRHFGIAQELTPDTAEEIWHTANALLATDAFRPLSLLEKWGVEILCTTDDPADDLRHHRQLREHGAHTTRIYPTFRPDAACCLHGPATFRRWVARLEAAAEHDIHDLAGLIDALRLRHDAFHALGCRLSDHGLETIDSHDCTAAEAQEIFSRLMRDQEVSSLELQKWRAFLMRTFAEWNHERGWVMMLHLGALRNNNSRMFAHLGLDTGCDSIGDFSHASGLNRFLDHLDSAGTLPRTILFNSNPRDNLVFATIAGNFFEDGVPGKVQYGPAWWFLDQGEGIRAQFDALCQVGLAHHFVGMVTDSRSFLSFSRHEYFRRIVCGLYAEEALAGLLPQDAGRLADTLTGICHRNARHYFDWEPIC